MVRPLAFTQVVKPATKFSANFFHPAREIQTRPAAWRALSYKIPQFQKVASQIGTLSFKNRHFQKIANRPPAAAKPTQLPRRLILSRAHRLEPLVGGLGPGDVDGEVREPRVGGGRRAGASPPRGSRQRPRVPSKLQVSPIPGTTLARRRTGAAPRRPRARGSSAP